MGILTLLVCCSPHLNTNYVGQISINAQIIFFNDWTPHDAGFSC